MAAPFASLFERLLAGLDEATASAVAATPSLAGELEAGLRAAREAWPEVALDEDRFLSHLATSITVSTVEVLPRLRWADLYLAAACAHGNDAAIRALTVSYRPGLEAGLAHLRLGRGELDEVLQRVWELLLVGPERGRRYIASYGGRGELGKWLRTVALRVAYRHLEDSGRTTPLDDTAMAAVPDGALDPGMEYLKRRYAAEFRAAFGAAVAALPPRDQLLLRRHHLDELTLEQLAKLEGVHRATVARRLADAREAVHRHVRHHLRQRLHVSDDEMHSLLRLVQSRLEVSIEVALADPGNFE